MQLLTETWVTATWDEYIQLIENPKYIKSKGYYHNGKMRVEMSPIGNDHASDHSIIIFAVSLFATIQGINFNSKDNCTYRKIGFQEVQPDVSYYIGEKANVIPYGTSIVNLDVYPVPDLVIEVANSSLADDKGEKRLMYEDLGVAEYWVLDVQNVQVIPFVIENGGSRRITESQVLPGLQISLLNEALRKTRQMDHSQVCSWLLSQFQQ
ncbi:MULTISPECIES: Uma2 family endonuclease [unclassified Anabaena]|uniref:Uma2 family endonuclease n=1 Tax=unclassified Anabaena TaxID=2619674 RepID=UPI001445C200|nr:MULTISPECIES: Uma2 family endonuclease [unclassified Anabaena]MTJ09415.1 Uma2 family endonuclease [Anabaena sp. UHCC 0204]MTJ55506.1 Uma2 family endonuclease [Anabaena sp. UHCC 0253]